MLCQLSIVRQRLQADVGGEEDRSSVAAEQPEESLRHPRDNNMQQSRARIGLGLESARRSLNVVQAAGRSLQRYSMETAQRLLQQRGGIIAPKEAWKMPLSPVW